MATPTPAQIHYMQAHISDDKRPQLIVASVVPLSLACVAVILRLVARRRSRVPLLAEDWWICTALIITICFIATSAKAVHNGLGRHTILVTNPESLVKFVLASQTLYCIAIVPVKISVLILYHRIFPSRRIYVASIAIGTFVTAYSAAQAIALGLQCIPLSSLWSRKPGKCFSTIPLFTTTAILNILTDVMILLLPIPNLWKLQVSRTSKIQLFVTFALGGLTIVFAIARATVDNPLPYDPSYGDVMVAIWSSIEIPTGIVSACLPTLRPLLRPKSPQKSGNTSTKRFQRTATTATVKPSSHNSEDYQLLNRPMPSQRMDTFRRVLEEDGGERTKFPRVKEESDSETMHGSQQSFCIDASVNI